MDKLSVSRLEFSTCCFFLGGVLAYLEPLAKESELDFSDNDSSTSEITSSIFSFLSLIFFIPAGVIENYLPFYGNFRVLKEPIGDFVLVSFGVITAGE